MSNNNFNSEFEEVNENAHLDSDEIREVIVTQSGKSRRGRKRYWREIDNLHDKRRLEKVLKSYDL